MLIALATWSGLPGLTPDDQLLAAALRNRGARAVPAVWDAPGIDWASFDAVVIRSTWDYHTRFDEFLAWLDRLEQAGARVWNPLPVLRWNANKSYLRDLDVPRVPTVYVPRSGDVGAAMRANRWKRAVVKPNVAATAFETRVIEHGGIADRDVLVQPFVEAIAGGEWSIIFFGGRFSHSVLKRPRAGDFRVQSDFGGRVDVLDAGAAIIEEAARALRQSPPTLYARVDGVVIDGVFTLMELELLEPALFLGASDSAADRLADAIYAICA